MLGFTVIWHLEILLNTPVNAITLQIFLRALQLTTKEVYTFGLKFIAQVQGKQVQEISVICIQDEDNVTRGVCFSGRGYNC